MLTGVDKKRNLNILVSPSHGLREWPIGWGRLPRKTIT